MQVVRHLKGVMAILVVVALLVTGVGLVDNAYADSFSACSAEDADTLTVTSGTWGQACVKSVKHQAWPHKDKDGNELPWQDATLGADGTYGLREGDNATIHVAFNVDAKGFANGSVVVKLPDIQGTFAPAGTTRPISDANNNKIAEYQINADGTITITPTDDFYKENVDQGKLVTGEFDFTVRNLQTTNGGGSQLGSKSKVKVSNRDTLQVTKTGELLDASDGADKAGKLQQTIEITSDLGTSNDVNVVDTMRNMHLTDDEWKTLKVEKVLFDADDKEVSRTDVTNEIANGSHGVKNGSHGASKDGFSFTLPRMDNGSKYVITYLASAKSTENTRTPKTDELNVLPSKNEVTADACNGGTPAEGDSCKASDEWDYDESNPIKKYGGWENDNDDNPHDGGVFDWHITIRPEDVNLEGNWVYDDQFEQLDKSNTNWQGDASNTEHYMTKSQREDWAKKVLQELKFHDGHGCTLEWYTDKDHTTLVENSQLPADTEKVYGFKITVKDPFNTTRQDGDKVVRSDVIDTEYKTTVSAKNNDIPESSFVRNRSQINEFPPVYGVGYLDTKKVVLQKEGRLQPDGTVRWRAVITTYGQSIAGFTLSDYAKAAGMTLQTDNAHKPTVTDPRGHDITVRINDGSSETEQNLSDDFKWKVSSDGSSQPLNLSYKFPEGASVKVVADADNPDGIMWIEYSTSIPQNGGKLIDNPQGGAEKVHEKWINYAHLDGINAGDPVVIIRNPLKKSANGKLGPAENKIGRENPDTHEVIEQWKKWDSNEADQKAGRKWEKEKDEETPPTVVNNANADVNTNADGTLATDSSTRVAILDWVGRLGYSALQQSPEATGGQKYVLYDKLDQNGHADSDLSTHPVGMQWMTPAQQTKARENIQKAFAGLDFLVHGDLHLQESDFTVTFYKSMDPSDWTKNVEATGNEDAVGFSVSWTKKITGDNGFDYAADDNPATNERYLDADGKAINGPYPNREYWGNHWAQIMANSYASWTYQSTASVDQNGYTPLLEDNIDKGDNTDKNGNNLHFKNTMWFGPFTQTATHEYDKRRNVVGKSGTFDGQNSKNKTNDITYTLDVNPNHMKFTDGPTPGTLELTDAMTYNPDCTKTTSDGKALTSCKLSIALKGGTVSVKDMDETDSTKQELDPKDYTFTSDAGKQVENGKLTNTMTFRVPDGKHLQITYTYHASVTPPANTGKVMLTGVENTAAIVGRNGRNQLASAQMADAAQGHAVGLTLVKVDADDNSLKLANAQFKLCKWTGSDSDTKDTEADWTDCKTPSDKSNTYSGNDYLKSDDGTTDPSNKGHVQLFQTGGDYDPNTAYRLEETQAPNGYTSTTSETKYFYFIIRKGENSKPDGQNGEKKPVDFPTSNANGLDSYFPEGYVITFPNRKIRSISSLPFTGGMSARDWLIVGGTATLAAALSAALTYAYRRRKGFAA